MEVEEEMLPYRKLAIAVLTKAIDDLNDPRYTEEAVDFLLSSAEGEFWRTIAGVDRRAVDRKVKAIAL